MKNKLQFTSEAYQGETFGSHTEFYQYAMLDGDEVIVTWLYDQEELYRIESMDDLEFSLEDIRSIRKL